MIDFIKIDYQIKIKYTRQLWGVQALAVTGHSPTMISNEVFHLVVSPDAGKNQSR
jgi:hypothetical protein